MNFITEQRGGMKKKNPSIRRAIVYVVLSGGWWRAAAGIQRSPEKIPQPQAWYSLQPRTSKSAEQESRIQWESGHHQWLWFHASSRIPLIAETHPPQPPPLFFHCPCFSLSVSARKRDSVQKLAIALRGPSRSSTGWDAKSGGIGFHHQRRAVCMCVCLCVCLCGFIHRGKAPVSLFSPAMIWVPLCSFVGVLNRGPCALQPQVKFSGRGKDDSEIQCA